MEHSFTVLNKESSGKVQWIAMSLEICGCMGMGKTAEEAIAILSANERIYLENDYIHENASSGSKEVKQMPVSEEYIPEMVTIREASKRTGLSYDFLRRECLRGNLVHIRIGNGKYLINMDLLKQRLETSHG